MNIISLIFIVMVILGKLEEFTIVQSNIINVHFLAFLVLITCTRIYSICKTELA